MCFFRLEETLAASNGLAGIEENIFNRLKIVKGVENSNRLKKIVAQHCNLVGNFAKQLTEKIKKALVIKNYRTI